MREVNGVLHEGLEPTQQIKGDEVRSPGASGTKVAVALVSGGIDSPVAVARMLAQGWIIYPLHGSLEPLTGDEAERKTISCLRQLSNNKKLFQKNSNLVEELFVIPIGDTLSLFTDKKMHRDYFVHMKRLLNVMANRLAEEVGATHIITGENIGQVSSQTLGNLGAVERSSERPILRPLLALDKVDIIHMAQALGTFEISTGPEDCDIIGPNHPTTVADLRRLEENEKDIGGLEEIVNAIWDELRIVEVG
ncbi:MAG TPA: hypothetical protein EYQ53_07005 [Candidatus Poseidoniales archaeon]|jgi:thiamine biosynthesis protein ThiI|nr:MAG: hypothetical protein CXT69_02335 [Euryarchaeota archaeon]HIG04108.1 hypothetical protein [Candidatus Poseidoniales archaeon]HIK78691.1 hypothetical protein [Candidatus Poseidoniales archaeon]